MSLAATLAASGMRPASYLPTIKCSSCGDEIEISAMGEHICSGSPISPKAQPASLSNAFTLRQMNAMETKPILPSPLQFNGSGTNPAQPSPLQFTGNGTRPAQPSPLQFTSGSQQLRPRAPTAGSATLSIPKTSRPTLPRINPDAANQPFLGPIPPQSPASSTRSASSSGSRVPPKRSMTSPMPRLWDRPPSPELSANLDCAFPPFPTPSIVKRKASNASQSSSRSGSRPDMYALEPRSPTSAAGGSRKNSFNSVRSGLFEKGSRRPSNEDKSSNTSARPSPSSTPLSPLEEFSIPKAPSPLSISSPASPIKEEFPFEEANNAPDMSRSLSQKRTPPQRPPRPDEPLPAILTSGPSSMARQPSQKKIPPERPARPVEGLPASLLSPLTLQTFDARGPPSPSLPPPIPLQNVDRSRTPPASSRASNDTTSTPTLSKMASESALRFQANSTNSAQTPTLPRPDNPEDESRVDPRMRDAPPVPRSVQLHRTESLHKSSESGTSTASSILSFGNLSMGNSNTTAGTSPVGSASGSLDAFFANSIEKELEENALQVAGLSLKNQQQLGSRTEQPKDNALRIATSPLAAEVGQPGDEQSDEEFPLPSIPTATGGGSWPLESPMDPELHDGILGGQETSSPKELSPVEPKKELLAPESPKLERLSSAVYDPKRPFSPAQPPPEEEQPEQNRPTSRSSLDSFKGFNFGSAFATTPVEQQPDSALSSRKPSESAPSTTSETTPTPTPPPPPPPAPPAISQPPPVPETTTPKPGLMRRGTTGVKAACRGCRKQIEGKSVKAADGRLTGRWHKSCFVCHTCKQAFETADFYVINNQPYCEQHYHEKNGSLCYGCQRGIEGQFLETRSGPGGRVVRKYHRKCFTCVDCRMVLADDYFEIDGRIHCERHALAAMRSQTAGAHPPSGSTTVPRASSGLRAEESVTTNERRPAEMLRT